MKTITIRIDGEDISLPTTKHAVTDLLDRHGLYNKEFAFRIENSIIPELEGRTFGGVDIDKIQILAMHLYEQHEKSTLNILVYSALIRDFPPETPLDKLLAYSMDLEFVPTYPCANDEEYGDMLLMDDRISGLDTKCVSHQVIMNADLAMAGRLARERENGIYLDEFYIARGCYPPPELEWDYFPKVEDWLFKAEVTSPEPRSESITIEFPTEEEKLKSAAEDLTRGNLYDIQIRSITDSFSAEMWLLFTPMIYGSGKIEQFNAVTKRISEMTHDEYLKFKESVHSVKPRNLGSVETVITRICGDERPAFSSSDMDLKM